MSVPDKIYVREYPDGIARSWEERKKDNVVATIPHEYIRKDALIEKLEKVAAEYKNGVMMESLYGRICAALTRLLTY